MSNNAVYEGAPHHIVDVHGHEILLKPIEGERDQVIRLHVMAPKLIIDPTDDEWAAARRRPNITE